MFRATTRILVVTAACAALVALIFAMRAGATSATTTPQATVNEQNATTGTNVTNVQDTDGDNDGSVESATAEDTQDSAQPQEQDQELSGTVASVDSANSMFILTTASGAVTVQVSSATQYDDGLSALGSLQSGMNVTVDAAAQASGQALATEVKGPSDATDAADSSAPDSGN